MAEQAMRGRVIRMLMRRNAIAVENPALPGTPDVNYAEGWIELKWIREWPSRADTKVLFPTFTPQQRIWHIRRRSVGGISWMMVQCKKEWFLFDGAQAALLFNFLTHDELKAAATKHTDQGMDEERLLRWISQRQKVFTFNDDARTTLKRLLQRDTELPSIGTEPGNAGE